MSGNGSGCRDDVHVERVWRKCLRRVVKNSSIENQGVYIELSILSVGGHVSVCS